LLVVHAQERVKRAYLEIFWLQPVDLLIYTSLLFVSWLENIVQLRDYQLLPLFVVNNFWTLVQFLFNEFSLHTKNLLQGFFWPSCHLPYLIDRFLFKFLGEFFP